MQRWPELCSLLPRSLDIARPQSSPEKLDDAGKAYSHNRKTQKLGSGSGVCGARTAFVHESMYDTLLGITCA